MIRLLAVDMDGTCLNGRKQISDSTLSALRDAADAGVTVVPTTGRTVSCLPYQLQKENFYQYVISSNGACITDMKNKKDLPGRFIPWDRAADLLKKATELGLGVSVHADHDFILQGKPLQILGKLLYGKDAKYTLCERNIAEYLRCRQLDAEEIQLFYFSGNQREKTFELLKNQSGLQKAYDTHYAEIYADGASKGYALQTLAEHLRISREQIACIGDAHNDMPMFRVSGLKFAMGNAIPQLKDLADTVLPSNNEDGVAEAIRRYILP